MPYKGGGFDFPTSSGPFSVSGLGFRPQGVIMFGGNRPELDTLVLNRPGPGYFVSFNALDWQDHVTVRSLCVAPNGRSAGTTPTAYQRQFEGPISIAQDGSSATAIDYRADTISFDPDGFTLNVTHVPSGLRRVHWLAWGGPQFQTGAAQWQITATTTFPNQDFQEYSEVQASYVTYEGLLSGAVTYDGLAGPAWQPLSTLVLSTLAQTGFGEGTRTGDSYMSVGSGHYPAISDSPNDWSSSVSFAQVQITGPAGRQGFVGRFVETVSTNPSAYHVSHVIGTSGPALTEGFRRHRPETVGSTTLINEGSNGVQMFHHAAWWNGEGQTAFAPIPTSVGATIDIAAPGHFNPLAGPAEWQAMLFTTINGGSGSGTGAQQRFGIGILTPDYQGCVVIGSDGGFFQSSSRCVANCPATGAETVSGQFLANGAIRLRCESGNGFDAVYHGFGGPLLEVSWIPQIYRRILSGPGVN